MKQILLLVAVLAACGDDGGTTMVDAPMSKEDAAPKLDAAASSWQDVVDEFANALCVNSCVPANEQQQCVADVKADMMSAMTDLDAAGETNCIRCMKKKTELLPAIVAAGCMSTMEQDNQVYAACDLDPNVDYDMDGTPNNDDDEACAGKP